MCNRYRPARGEELEWLEAMGFPDTPVGGNIGPIGLKDIGPRQGGVFVRVGPSGGLEEVAGTWGLIADSWRSPEPPKIRGRPQMTNNARVESIAELRTFAAPWARGQRCIIPAAWWVEPNWETGRNVWWRMRLRGPYAAGMAGIWNTWVSKETGEVVESYAMVTMNADGHSILGRMHRPDPDRPPDKQDKRAVVALRPSAYLAWLYGDEAAARAALQLPEAEEIEAAPEHATPQLF